MKHIVIKGKLARVGVSPLNASLHTVSQINKKKKREGERSAESEKEDKADPQLLSIFVITCM